MTPGDAQLNRLQILYGLKRLLGRDRKVNVTPFTESQIINYQTDVRSFDVPEIHGRPRHLIEDAVREVLERQTAQVVLLSSNPGMGKSHLLNHFRQPEVARGLNYILVSPTNHWDVGDFVERLLDSLLSALVTPSTEGPHPLLDRVQALAFTALGQLLDQPNNFAAFRPRRHWLRRTLARFSGSDHARLAQMLAHRDAAAFRLLDFQKFSGYVCDRFLAEPGNPLHRYVLRVLLCYLFPQERELVLHWFRQRQTLDHFTRKFGADEALDRTYKRMDAVRLLMSLFSREVSRGLSGQAAEALAPRVFFLAFDQTEGRDELFQSQDDWFKFFAQLSELYNSLPNVLILFTMTLGLRDRLHALMEKQFQDRILRDQRFALNFIEDAEILALYRGRLDRWLGQEEKDLHGLLANSENPYLPFDQAETLRLANGDREQSTLREMLKTLDTEFRARLLALPSQDVSYDYLLWLNELRPKLTGDVYQDTAAHLETVTDLLTRFGARFAAAHGLQLLDLNSFQTENGLDGVELRLCRPNSPAGWVRIKLVRLPFQYNNKLDGCVRLLTGLRMRSNFLWLVRAKPIESEVETRRTSQIFCRLLPAETEMCLHALLSVLGNQSEYTHEVWQKGEEFLIGELNKTYLGELFRHAAGAVAELNAPDQPDDQPDPGEPMTVTAPV